RELTSALKTGVLGHSVQVAAGIELSVPQQIAFQFLAPALRSVDAPKLVSYRARRDALIADLHAYDADIVIMESPYLSTAESVHSHEIDARGVSFFCARQDAKWLARNFPFGFEGAPFLCPIQGSEFGRHLDEWFKRAGVSPTIVARFEEPGLMCEVGEEGLGIFAQPTILEDCVLNRYRVDLIGRAPNISLKYYAVLRDQRFSHAFIADMAARRTDAPDTLSVGGMLTSTGRGHVSQPHTAVSRLEGRA
ncbi:MAG TPA: LysR substrate-binding domain-containing protein, partial [Gammaproteobacteria bacterium]|nr:LysR substrate-binding domain-containing protein [Gammaproteobacteria bacterium]